MQKTKTVLEMFQGLVRQWQDLNAQLAKAGEHPSVGKYGDSARQIERAKVIDPWAEAFRDRMNEIVSHDLPGLRAQLASDSQTVLAKIRQGVAPSDAGPKAKTLSSDLNVLFTTPEAERWNQAERTHAEMMRGLSDLRRSIDLNTTFLTNRELPTEELSTRLTQHQMSAQRGGDFDYHGYALDATTIPAILRGRQAAGDGLAGAVLESGVLENTENALLARAGIEPGNKADIENLQSFADVARIFSGEGLVEKLNAEMPTYAGMVERAVERARAADPASHREESVTDMVARYDANAQAGGGA